MKTVWFHANGRERIRTGRHLDALEVLAMAKRGGDVIRGMLAGMVGGLAGSVAMMVYMESVSKIAHADQPAEGDDVTATLAARTMSGLELSGEARQAGGTLVHYGFGMIVGGVYGAAVEYLPFVKGGFGTLYGTTLFVLADEFSLPRLELAYRPADESKLDQLGHLAAHLVYGVATEAARRAIGACL